MTTHHTDEKKPALGGLVEDEFWAQMESLAAKARQGDAAAAFALSQRVLRMSALSLKAANNSDGAGGQQLHGCTHGFGHHIRLPEYGGKVVCTACYQIVGD